ncbi:MAG: type VI secretion system tip protein VgrG [Sandaracinaceae bacterium]|nr:type VI secretion system tip protein VgrG [Sandaracinaceae bacterium]
MSAIFTTRHVTLAEHPDLTIRPYLVRVTEALDAPYRVLVRAEVESEAEASTFVGGDAVVELARGGTVGRRFCGVVTRVRELPASRSLQVELVIEPALVYAAQRRDTRVFQGKTAPEIVQEVLGAVLGDLGRSVDDRLEGTYPTREHCVQYRETDLAFVQRLLEEEGIFYLFEHDGDVETMVLADTNGAFVDVPSGPVFPYEPSNLQIGDREGIHRFDRVHQAVVTSVVARDWDWTASAGGMTLEAERRGEDAEGRDRESYEHSEGRSLSIWSYDEGVRRYQEQDGDVQVGRRLEAHAREHVLIEGVTSVQAMVPGTKLEIVRHPTVGMDGTYVVVRAVHDAGSPDGGAANAGTADAYGNRIWCIPASVPHRPRRRHVKPRIHGAQTAVVTGPAGEEIHVDEHGRIRAQLHWDRLGANDDTSAMWIRVRQPWAGDGWGFWWVPRIGMEVMVQFVDGDPDRPLVIGSLYDGANPTPYSLPDNKTKSTIKSNSSLGGGGFNEFRFEDLAGQEEIYTHAQKDYDEEVEHDHNTLVHNCQTNEVDGNQTQTVHGNQTERVDVNQTMTVDANRTVHVKSNFDEEVLGTETLHVVGDVEETFEATETRTVTGDVTETIVGDETRTIVGDQTETIGGSHTMTILGSSTETVTGSWSRTVTGGITTTTPATFSITAVGGHSVTAAGGINYIAPAGMTVIAPGGVKRVDSFWDVYCGSHLNMGQLCTEAWVYKESACLGIALALVSMKAEDVVMALVGSGIDMADEVAALKNATTHLVLEGAELGNEFVLRT